MPARAASSTISTPSSPHVQAQEQVDRWAESERNRKPAGTTAEPTALKVNPGPNPGDGPKARAADGEAGAIGEPEPPRPRRLPKIDPADAERDKAIEQALENTASITFPEGTTLDQVLATLRESTRDAKAGLPKGVPIYVDPLVLVEDRPGQEKRRKVFKTIAPIELEDVPLRVVLRLALDQFSLSYQIRDRMVYINDEELVDLGTEGGIEFRSANGGVMRMGGMRGMNMGGPRNRGMGNPGGMM